MIGRQDDGSVRIPTNQTLYAEGSSTVIGQRPVDMALRPDGKQLALTTTDRTYLVDVETHKVTQSLDPGGRNFAGIAYSPDGTHLYYSMGSDHKIGLAAIDSSGNAIIDGHIDTGANTWPAGLSVSPDGTMLYVALFGTNELGIIDVQHGVVVKTLPVGSSPFGSYVSPSGKFVYTSNWGGPRPSPDQPTDPLFPVVIDPRTGAAASGTISVYDVAHDATLPEISVGLHPTAIIFDKDATRAYVANANEDTVSVLDITPHLAANPELERISVAPADNFPFGSMPNGLALSPDGTTLYVANGGNNAIAVIRLSAFSESNGSSAALTAPDARKNSEIAGFIPTEWYPIAVAVSPDGRQLYAANNKGFGSLNTQSANGARSVVNDLTGSVTFVDVPDADRLSSYTARFEANNLYDLALSDALQPSRSDAAPVPVPARIGEPSVFKHVLYIIKENRTYDQVLGDFSKGNGAQQLTQFPQAVTPNQHALADRFGLLDNYYASSVNSADGHQWTDEAVANVFAERVYGFYPSNNPKVSQSYGNSSLDLPPDSLFSNAIAHGITLRNYGEDGIGAVNGKNSILRDGNLAGASWDDLYKDWKANTGIYTVVASNALTPPLRTSQDIYFPTFSPLIPDQIRVDEWLREFTYYVRVGNLPQLSVMELGNDHTSGTTPGYPTPQAAVADNDLALGRIIDSLSHSPYWQDTAVFVTEDDAQDGVDHVDGHRTVGMVISAYSKQGIVDSALYNQTSMVRTIEQILGLPPMNQFDLTAPLMTTLFDTKPDFTSYTALPNQIPLDTLNPPASSLTGQAQQDAIVSSQLDFSIPDATDPAILNPIIWRATMGDRPYPHFDWGKRDTHSDGDDG
jgi:YVTN family beta-propeller protein